MPEIMPPEYVVPVPARNIVVCVLLLYTWVGTLYLQYSGDLVSEKLFVVPLRPASTPTSDPNTMSWELTSGMMYIPTHTFCTGELQPGGHQIPGDEGPVAPTPNIFTPSSSTVDVRGFDPVD